MFNVNGRPTTQLPDDLLHAQRALYYADALFETIRAFDGHLPFIDRHWARLSGGMKSLNMSIPNHWDSGFFQQEIEKTGAWNARIRLTVWRKPGGRLLPEINDVSFLIETEPLPENTFTWNNRGLRVGICPSLRLTADDLSCWKSLNIARYAQAAQIARANGWDDALLLNARDRIVESSICNLFWVKNNQVFTPPLSEGCVAGVLRGYLLDKLPEWGISVTEKAVLPVELAAADEVLLTNAVRGVQWVAGYPGEGTLGKEIFLLLRGISGNASGNSNSSYDSES
ncbi:MAG: aminotransferase class IV [Saprospiraceae bacterium]|nr:aminotransferase class IV [Saprospiraceae bacterium]